MYVLSIMDRKIKLWYRETTGFGTIVYSMTEQDAKTYRSKKAAEADKAKIDAKDNVCMTVEKV